MTAFVSISPAAAREILQGISQIDALAFVSHFIEAGKVRAYADVIETLAPDGHTIVRDARIPTALWRRIVAEGKLEEVLASSSVKLEGDGLVGGRPAVTVTGVRLNEKHVRDVMVQHSPTPPLPIPWVTAKPVKAKPEPAQPSAAVRKPVQPAIIVRMPDAPPLITANDDDQASTPPKVRRASLSADAVTLSIAETEDVLGISRGTVNNMVNRGDLQSKKIGRRTLIIAESVRAYLGMV